MIRKHKITKEKGLELFTNEHSKFEHIQGMDIHYRDEGKGFPLVLVHGLGGSLHNWDKITDSFLKHYRVIRLDLPGFGLSGFSEDLDIPKMVDIIHELLKKMKISSCHMIGNSMGGWISWEFAVKYPSMVSQLVLMNSAGFFGGKEKVPTLEIIKRPMFKKIMKRGVPRLLILIILKRQVFYGKKATKQMIDRYYKMINIDGNFERLFLLAKMTLSADTEKLKSITSPTLIIWGKQDPTQPVEYAYEFHKRIPGSELEIYDKVGHIPMIEVPHRTFADILSFFMKNKG